MASKDPRPVFILTGDTGSGKTTFLLDMIDALRRQNISMAGFTAISDPGDGAPGVYQIADLVSGRKLPLAARRYTEGWENIGNFYFNPEAIRLGKGLLEDPRITDQDLIIIDEIGPFELSGEVWAEPVTALLDRRSCPVLLVVRASLVEKVMEQWSLPDARVFTIRETTPGQAVEHIISATGEKDS